MKRNALVLLIFSLTMIAGILLLMKKEDKEYKKIEGFIQGTTYQITYECNKDDDFKPEIELLLHNFDTSLSSYIPNSIISRINRNDSSVAADDWFIEVFNKSKEVNKNTNGAFDLTVAPIVDALGFGPTKGIDIDSSRIDSLKQFVGMNKVRLEGRKLIKDNPSVMIDVNALAQGFSVDVVCRFLDQRRIHNYIVEIGGELRASGVNPKGSPWHVGIDKPIEGNMNVGEFYQAVLAIKNKAVATSGNYRKFHVVKGIKYAHIINPATGYPALSNLLSTTVIADDCITADAYATALMVFGLNKSIAFLADHKELEGMLIYSDTAGHYNIYTTENMKSKILKEIQ